MSEPRYVIRELIGYRKPHIAALDIPLQAPDQALERAYTMITRALERQIGDDDQ